MVVGRIHFPSAHSENDEICSSLAQTRNINPLLDFLQVLLQRMESEKKLLISHVDYICHLLDFIISYRHAPPLSSASVQRFSFSAFAKFASPETPSLPPGRRGLYSWDFREKRLFGWRTKYIWHVRPRLSGSRIWAWPRTTTSFCLKTEEKLNSALT